MLGNVYGLRLLRNPTIRDASLVLVTVILVLARIRDAMLVSSNQIGYDYLSYWTAAGRLLHGESIYTVAQLAGPYAPQGQEGFLYAPPFAALTIPFFLLSPSSSVPAAVLWSALGALIAAASVLALARAERLDERFPALAGWRIVLLLVAVFAMPGVLTELVNGNVQLELLGLFTLAWLGVRRGDATGERIAGLAIGIATLLKIFPVLAIAWFVVTRRWMAAGWAVIGAAAVSLVTLPVTGIQPWLDFPRALANMSAPTDPSVSFAPTVWLAPFIGFSIARIVVTLTGLAIVAWSGLRQDPRTSFAVAVIVSILITPALWSAYFSLLVMPMLVALGSGASVVAIGIVYVLLSAGVDTALGGSAWVVARLAPTLGALVLLVVALRLRRAEAPSGAELQAAPSAA